MWHQKNQLCLKETISLQKIVSEIQNSSETEPDYLGGFIQNGKLSWIVNGSTIEIFSVESGTRLSYCNFNKCPRTRNCTITCVEEISYYPNICILAIAIEFPLDAGGMISIFCVQGSKILGSMDFCEKITSCKQIHRDACKKSVLRQFHGCIGIGTDRGKVFLIDIMLPAVETDVLSLPNQDSDMFICCNVLASVDQNQIAMHHKKIQRENSYFSIQLEVLNDSSAVLSILCLPNLFTLAVGLLDGRLVLYDLKDLQAFHLAYPPSNHAPLSFMSFLEPIDDPRSCVYIWAFHTSNDGAIAVMHSLMYEDKVNSIYENFKSCNVRLTMPIFDKDSTPVSCRSIRKVISQDEEDVLTLNLLAWNSRGQKQSHILIFDLNQWYKEEMPNIGDWRQPLNYVTTFSLSDISTLDVLVNEQSVFPFNSIQRPEEHFYPNSLSFEVSFLEADKFRHLFWPGIQNAVLDQFNSVGPQLILEPNNFYNEMMKVAIYPQLYDCIFNSNTPIDLKRDFLLSVALEYNFIGFLKKCAWSWADGSYLGKDVHSGLSLSTLTEWIWNRAKSLKEICNSLCEPLFDYSERRIDYGTQKMLSQCSRQLKSLSSLLHVIINNYQKFIPENVLEILNGQFESIKMASEYQEVLQWLLNVGLLPEGLYRPESVGRSMEGDENEFLIVPYPYCAINSYYMSQRMKFADDYLNLSRSKEVQEKNCKYLFIDTFIERECNAEAIYDLWKENGNGLYPPNSIQTLLRTLLIPNIPIENKYILFVYLFMDINSILNEGNKGRYSSIVQNLIKFPTVFKLDSASIKRTQAFWNLDNGHLEMAVEELISPLSHDKHLQQWQRELLIASLLKQKANSLALRALRSPGNPISNRLEIQTLLANSLMSEALRIQRSSGDPRLLILMFDKIINSSKCETILDLALTDAEGQILREYLEKADCLNMHLVFLLQRSRFVDAAALFQKVSTGKDRDNLNLRATKGLLDTYYSTLEPTSRHLTILALSEKEKSHSADKKRAAFTPPLPLSKSLIKSKLNVKNNIYQTSILNINTAGYGEKLREHEEDMPFICSPRLGIFEYQQQPIQLQKHNEAAYPFEINEFGKRKNLEHTKKAEKTAKEGSILFDDYLAPSMKRRKLNQQIMARKSYKDINLNVLTNFKDVKPQFNFATRNSSKQTTPERSSVFQFQRSELSTPVIKKRSELTPEKNVRNLRTPTSILKSRRNSVSPTPSRVSEFEEKSVKSITFAMPGTADSSFNDSSLNMDYSENSDAEEAINASSSSDNFYSPTASANTSLIESQEVPKGPKPRPALRSRSNTPNSENRSNTPSTVEVMSEVCYRERSKTPLQVVVEEKVEQQQEEMDVEEDQEETKEKIVEKSQESGTKPLKIFEKSVKYDEFENQDKFEEKMKKTSGGVFGSSPGIQGSTGIFAGTSRDPEKSHVPGIFEEKFDTTSEKTEEVQQKSHIMETRSRSRSKTPQPGATNKAPSSDEKQQMIRRKIAEEEAALQQIQAQRTAIDFERIFGEKSKSEDAERPGTSGVQQKTPEKSDIISINSNSPDYSPLKAKSILKDESDVSLCESSQDSEVQELTVYGKSILKTDFDATIDQSSDDDGPIESPLPENVLGSDYEDDDDEEEMIEEHEGDESEGDGKSSNGEGEEQSEYGDFNLDDSNESNIYDEEDPEDDSEQDDGEDNRNSDISDVIEILSSSEEESRNFSDIEEIKQEASSFTVQEPQEIQTVEDLEQDNILEDLEGNLYELKPCQEVFEPTQVTTTVEIHQEINLGEELIVQSRTEVEENDGTKKIEIVQEIETKIVEKEEVIEMVDQKSQPGISEIQPETLESQEPLKESQEASEEIEVQISMISETKSQEVQPIETEEKMDVDEPEIDKLEQRNQQIGNIEEAEIILETPEYPQEAEIVQKSDLEDQIGKEIVEEKMEIQEPEKEEEIIEKQEAETDVAIEIQEMPQENPFTLKEIKELPQSTQEPTIVPEIIINSQESMQSVESKDISFVSAVDELNNAALISDLTSQDSSTIESSNKLNEAAILEEITQKSRGSSADQSDFYGFEREEIVEEDDPMNLAVIDSRMLENVELEKPAETEILEKIEETEEFEKPEAPKKAVEIPKENLEVPDNSQLVDEGASGDNLNIALLNTQTSAFLTQEPSTSQATSETADKDALNVAAFISELSESSEIPEIPSTPKKTRSLRGKSQEPVDSARKSLRAKSVPKDIQTLSPKIKTRRTSADDRHNPKLLLKEKILEKIEENEEAPLTPSRIMTRRRSAAESPAPATPTRATRRKSMLSDDGNETPTRKSRRLSTEYTNTPDTPRRMTRAASRELLNTSAALLDKFDEIEEREDDEKSEKSEKTTKSSRSTRKSSRKIQEPVIVEEEGDAEASTPEVEEINASSRRLTRSQLAVLEKSRQIAEKLSSKPIKKRFVVPDSESDDLAGSDMEEEKKSVRSTAQSSGAQSKRRGRSKKSTSEDDNVSVSSSKSESPEKRTRAGIKLSVIPEESQVEDETSERATRRGRKKN